MSDTQRQDQERTHPRNNESDSCLQRDHGETTKLVLTCVRHVMRRDEEQIIRKVLRTDIPWRKRGQDD